MGRTMCRCPYRTLWVPAMTAALAACATARAPLTVTIEGSVQDTAQHPLANALIQVVGTRLYANADDSGRFSLPATLQPGRHELRIMWFGYTPGERAVRLRRPGVVNLGSIMLAPFDQNFWFTKCIRSPFCASVMRRGQGPAGPLPSTTDSLLEVGLRAVAGLSLVEYGAVPRPLMCAHVGSWRDTTPPDSAVLTALRTEPVVILSTDACQHGDRHLVLGAEKPLWWEIYAEVRNLVDDSAVVAVGYVQSPLSAAWWDCRVQDLDYIWRTLRCDLTGVS